MANIYNTTSTSVNISVPTLVPSISQENILHRTINQPSSPHTSLYTKHQSTIKKSYNASNDDYEKRPLVQMDETR